MPTYAYACSACEHAFDIRQSFNDLPLTTCPRCEQETLRKLFSPVGVVFKGSGFYRTDSRAAAQKAGGAEKSSSTAGDAAGAGSSSAEATSSSAGKGKGKGAEGSTGSAKPSGPAPAAAGA